MLVYALVQYLVKLLQPYYFFFCQHDQLSRQFLILCLFPNIEQKDLCKHGLGLISDSPEKRQKLLLILESPPLRGFPLEEGLLIKLKEVGYDGAVDDILAHVWILYKNKSQRVRGMSKSICLFIY